MSVFFYVFLFYFKMYKYTLYIYPCVCARVYIYIYIYTIYSRTKKKSRQVNQPCSTQHTHKNVSPFSEWRDKITLTRKKRKKNQTKIQKDIKLTDSPEIMYTQKNTLSTHWQTFAKGGKKKKKKE
ncbi:unnamed protein product [Ixodes pacificus]